ncbi:MAG: hypothetical protein DHS80DRAFT_13560 [Piptocephalis tieghemiana]|nr:MAG: hypothetical protein DHS80DRAFT_13560 [Piptocephalis tieghemiana]
MKDFLGKHKSEEEAQKAHDEVYKEKKAHLSHELIGAAAGYEAVKAYQKHRAEKGKNPTHSTIKQIVGGLAMAEAVKQFETRGNGDVKAKREAAAAAAAQAESMV